MTRVTLTGSASSDKDVLAVSICEPAPTNEDTQSPVVGKVVTHRLQEVEGMNGKDAEADGEGELVEQIDEANNSSSLCPQHASPSACDGFMNEVSTGAVVEDSSEREDIVELQKKAAHKKRKRRKKAAKWTKKKVTVKSKQNVPLVGNNLDATINNQLDDAANNQGDKEDFFDQRKSLDGQTEQSDDQTKADHRKELVNQRQSSDQSECDELANLEHQKEESDGQLNDQAEIGNYKELGEELSDQKGLENQKEESDGQVKEIDDQTVGNQRELVDQSEELSDQCGLEDQTEELCSRVEGLDEVGQKEDSESKSLVDQNKEQVRLDDQLHDQELDNQILREDSNSQTGGDQSEVSLGSVVTRKNDTTPAVTTITTTITTTTTTTTIDSSDSAVTDDLKQDNINGGMEAVDVTSKDSQTSTDNQPKLPNMKQQTSLSSLPSASCENEASPKTSQCNDTVGQEVDEHSKDSNVTTMLFEEQKQHSAVKLPSAQGKSKKGLSKRKKGRRPKKSRPQTVVQGNKSGRGQPRKVVVQEVPDSTVAPNNSSTSKQEENYEKSPEPLVSSTSKVDEVSSSRDAPTVTQGGQKIGTEPELGLFPPDIVTSSTYDENTTTCSALPEDSSSTTGSLLPSDHVVPELTTVGSQPSPHNTNKVVNRLGNKPGYRRLRKRQSVAATMASATKKLKFDEVGIKRESSTEKGNGSLHFPVFPSVESTEPTMRRQRKRGKSTMATVKSEVISSSEQKMMVTSGVAPLATVNRWAYQ